MPSIPGSSSSGFARQGARPGRITRVDLQVERGGLLELWPKSQHLFSI
jgi:hypothetical protein